MNLGNWTWSRAMHACCHYLKCLPQIRTKINGFKFKFSNIFWGGAHRAPSPDPSPRFFLGLCSRFGPRLQFSGVSRLRLGFRPRFSGALRPWFGVRTQLSIKELSLPLPQINSLICHWFQPMLLVSVIGKSCDIVCQASVVCKFVSLLKKCPECHPCVSLSLQEI